MSAIRVELTSKFKGETVVLLAMDGDGVDAVRSAVIDAESSQRQSSTLRFAGRELVITVGSSEGVMDFQEGTIIWRVPRSQVDEIVRKLDAMRASKDPCHHYVDITAPANTLVLSKDEYVR